MPARNSPAPWVIDAKGRATDDPNVLFADPKGALLPLGGLDAGYKGFGLALLIEALTAGLAGFGRADPSEGWGATVFVQALDPAAFGGDGGFGRQTARMADACHAATPATGRRPRPRSRARRAGACASSASTGSRSTRRSCPRCAVERKLGVAPPPVVG